MLRNAADRIKESNHDVAVPDSPKPNRDPMAWEQVCYRASCARPDAFPHGNVGSAGSGRS